jgi:hypothetical protein
MSDEFIRSQIIEAIKRGDPATALSLIGAGEGLDEYDAGLTLMVSEDGDTKIFRHGRTPLIVAAESGEIASELYAPNIAREVPMKTDWHLNSFSATNPAKTEESSPTSDLTSKLPAHLVALSRLTRKGRGKLFHFCSFRIEFGNGCDHPNYVATKSGSIIPRTSSP